MKEWLFLIGAIFLETFATSMLKYSEQFTKLLPTTAMVVGYMFSFYCQLLSAVIDANPKFHKLYQSPYSVCYFVTFDFVTLRWFTKSREGY